VEAQSNKEFKASVLGAYERGERSISVPRLQRLAAIYNVPVDQLLPRPDSEWSGIIDLSSEDAYDSSARSEGSVVLDLGQIDAIEGPERDVLRRYLGSIQVQRQDFNGRMITIRAEDVEALGRFLDLSPEGMRNRLETLGLCLHR
ncbi:MAG TPA: transcriptional regulator, partial [Acidimicrobiales bacterium]|nr:transcriptional regulator [Acidimicrobiales bacterium]